MPWRSAVDKNYYEEDVYFMAPALDYRDITIRTCNTQLCRNADNLMINTSDSLRNQWKGACLWINSSSLWSKYLCSPLASVFSPCRFCEVPGMLGSDPARPEDRVWRGNPCRPLSSAGQETWQEVHTVLKAGQATGSFLPSLLNTTVTVKRPTPTTTYRFRLCNNNKKQ